MTIKATTIMTLLAFGSLSTLMGCANKQKETEPRPDTRPMVNAIQQAEQDWSWISKEQWHLHTIEGQSPIQNTNLRINFKEHTWLEGDAGCNRFTASYIRRADAGLKVTEVLTTRMYCAQPTGVMQQESRFFHLLKQIDAYHAEPTKLQMLADGAVVLTFTTQEDE